jgi:hypothetical protein
MNKSSVITLRSPENRPLAGAYSRPLRRGVLGDIDGRSKEGRFLKTIESDLIEQVGGSPSVGQQLLIRRIARSMLMLEILDLKLANGDNWNQCDAATQGGLNNNETREPRNRPKSPTGPQADVERISRREGRQVSGHTQHPRTERPWHNCDAPLEPLPPEQPDRFSWRAGEVVLGPTLLPGVRLTPMAARPAGGAAS